MLWFLDTLVGFPVSHADGGDGISVLTSLARHGDAPPLHAHTTEDECFHLLEGELVFLVDGTTRCVRAGETVLAPKGVAHTYRVVSEQASWLVITTCGDFERFVRAASRPAEYDGLPAPGGVPSDAELEAFAELARTSGIEIVGPPLAAEVAEAARAAA
jgi:quercetin dioxygenase-like cupin family protein